jgi:hypothetical protein
MADEPQEKQLPFLPSSDASEAGHQKFSSEGLVMVLPPRFPLESILWK